MATESKSTESKSTAANERQAKAADDNAKAQEKAAARSEGSTLKVELRDQADSTVDAVTRDAARLGGLVKSTGKGTITVESPPEAERNPDSQRQKLVEGLLANPLVNDVETS